MYRKWWDLRAQAGDGGGGGGGGGGGEGAVDPVKAREFVAAWAPSPDVVKALPDDQVVAWHGNITKNLTAAQQDALSKHDWRKDIAGEDPDRLKTLERFASPKALYESYDQFRTRMSKGELRAVTEFPKTGSAEQQNQWRSENGVPESPEKYELKMPDGIVIGEADKPVLDGFLKYAHTQNMPQGEVNKAATWYFQERIQRQEQAHATFEQNKLDTAAELGQEWGPEYKATHNKIQGVLDATIPAGEKGDQLKTLISNAIATNPLFARHYAQIALQINPAGTLVSGDRGANEASVTDRLKVIDAEMKKDRAAYNKDEKKQTEYRELLGAYEKLTGKRWGQG